jgi:hypothetical protein
MTDRRPFEPNHLIALPEGRLIEDRNARLAHMQHEAEVWAGYVEAMDAGAPPPTMLDEPMPLAGCNREIFEAALTEIPRDEEGTFSAAAFIRLIASKIDGIDALAAAKAIVARAQMDGGTHQDGWIEIDGDELRWVRE